ncbi:MAG: methyltransferase domain-containing protein [Opitutaceae bacterium]|jgi:hypothetical protein|nr:methyltransferase domain-containing protein [Opitutaceae bacterium]
MNARRKNPPPDTAFAKEQFDAIYPDGVQHHYWTLARNRIIADELRKSLSMNAGGGGLEIGCGRGVVVASLRARGFEVRGVELAPISPVAGAENFVRAGTDAFALPEAERRGFRYLLLLDVLEHLPDPAGFLEKTRAAFPNAAFVMATVPARMSLWSNWDELNGHFLRHDFNSVQALADAAGGTLLRRSHFFHALWLPARLLLLAGRKRSERITPPRGRAALLAHRLLAFLFWCEHRLLPGKLPGSSLLFVLSLRPKA